MIDVSYDLLNIKNWDGYDAKPVTPATVTLARAIEALLQSPPDVAPGGDGSIGFEWVANGNKIFLDVTSDKWQLYGRINNEIFLSNVGKKP